MIRADFTQLINALTSISNLPTEEAQLAALELRLIAAELNPSCLDFEHLTRALEVLAKLELKNRSWEETPKELESFFSKCL
jgi:hypothetical protein